MDVQAGRNIHEAAFGNQFGSFGKGEGAAVDVRGDQVAPQVRRAFQRGEYTGKPFRRRADMHDQHADESAEHPAYAGFRGNGKQGFGGNGSDSVVRNGNFAAADLFDKGNIRTD